MKRIYLGGDSVSIPGLTINNGLNSNDGGAIKYSGGGTLTVTDCVLVNNIAGLGGGLSFFGNGSGSRTLNITNCTFSGNSANGGRGGGLLVESASQVNIACSMFRRHS